ncbi:GDP-L-fucose synthase family protein [Ferrovibrio sp.]|uniref:GDP-L-fucose synthase family protein n=1 Tax=Ferrovibrio sp. TaxID=1917215 RepID=UPI003D2B10A5
MQPHYSLKGKKVWVAGHRGMAGSALVRRLATEDCEILTVPRADLDLRQQDAVERWLKQTRPDMVVIAAATVGGIHANNSRPAEFIYNNLMIEANIVHSAHMADVNKLVFLSSSCVYPRLAPQPMREEHLMTGPLEPTSEWYATAKIAGIRLAQAYRKQYGRDYISCIPASLYGIGDNYDPQQSHVLAATLVKLHNAKLNNAPQVEIWGTGKPTREFLSVDDMADGVIFLARHYNGHDAINIGTGVETSIRELVELSAEAVGYRGEFVHLLDKPDGMPRKVMDVSRMSEMGWSPKVALRDGLKTAYSAYLQYLAQQAA